MAKGLETIPERRRRTLLEMLRDSGLMRRRSRQREGGFDYFTTTLSISPLKNAQKLNDFAGACELAEEAGARSSIWFRISRSGTATSGLLNLSEEYGHLQGQDYCGCRVFTERTAKSRHRSVISFRFTPLLYYGKVWTFQRHKRILIKFFCMFVHLPHGVYRLQRRTRNERSLKKWHNYGAVVLRKRRISWFIISTLRSLSTSVFTNRISAGASRM